MELWSLEWAGHVAGFGMRNEYKILVGNDSKLLLERPNRLLESNIEINIRTKNKFSVNSLKSTYSG
jgi:hypothetical protein